MIRGTRGLEEIVVISLLVVLVFSSIVVIWYFIYPILFGLNMLSDIEPDTFSPSDNSPLNNSGNFLGNCKLIKAYWNNDSAVEGEVVSLFVEGESCDGSTVDFEIREDDGFIGYDPVEINPGSAVFVGNVLEISWKAEWQSDWIGDPEYYFVASVGDDSVKSERLNVGKSGKLSPLEVCNVIKDSSEGR